MPESQSKSDHSDLSNADSDNSRIDEAEAEECTINNLQKQAMKCITKCTVTHHQSQIGKASMILFNRVTNKPTAAMLTLLPYFLKSMPSFTKSFLDTAITMAVIDIVVGMWGKCCI